MTNLFFICGNLTPEEPIWKFCTGGYEFGRTFNKDNTLLFGKLTEEFSTQYNADGSISAYTDPDVQQYIIDKNIQVKTYEEMLAIIESPAWQNSIQ